MMITGDQSTVALEIAQNTHVISKTREEVIFIEDGHEDFSNYSAVVVHGNELSQRE